jgi:ABC-type transport system involved in multi-copper enzyme maturation permease subunit
VDKLRAITFTAFQEAIRRRVFYIVLLLALLIVVSVSSQMIFLRMARQAGETAVIEQLRAGLVRDILQPWSQAGLFLALFLGATGISSEISGQTIVHIFSRPVSHFVYLLGRWFGLLIFLWVFLFCGIMGGLIAALCLQVSYAPALWLAFAEMFVTVTFFSGVALGFSVTMPPALAGAGTVLVALLPLMARGALSNPRPVLHALALAAYYLGPARMPDDLLDLSFDKGALHLRIGLDLLVLGENLLYAVAVFAIAILIFRRRELPLR